MKDFTIVRRRVVTQICTDQYRAKTQEEALAMANADQNSGDEGNEVNEWFPLSDSVEYPILDDTAILEVNEVKE